MDVQKLRNEIPVLANLTYMNTGWSGPPPRRAAEAMKERADLELERGPTTADVYESGRLVQADAREAAARLLNAPLESVLVTRKHHRGPQHRDEWPRLAGRRRNHHLQPGAQLGALAQLPRGPALRRQGQRRLLGPITIPGTL